MVRFEHLASALADDNAGRHGIAGNDARHDRSVRDPQLIDARQHAAGNLPPEDEAPEATDPSYHLEVCRFVSGGGPQIASPAL
jgi:hypothetical protein